MHREVQLRVMYRFVKQTYIVALQRRGVQDGLDRLLLQLSER